MKIGQTSSLLAAYQAGQKPPVDAKKAKSTETAPTRNANAVEISDEAREKSEALESARELRQHMPDLSGPREEKIQEVKARIEDGHYGNLEVRRNIASLLISIYGSQSRG